MFSSSRAGLPHPITEKSPILVSHIPLPVQPSIAYAKFIPILQQDQHKALELSRQRIINDVRLCCRSIEESLLPIVHVGKEEAALWVFSIRSLEHNQQHSAGGKGKQKADCSVFRELHDLVLDNLQRCDLSHFSPSALYPCSLECAKLQDPCSCCTSMLSNSSTVRGDTFPTSSSSIFFPRLSLRAIYTLFIDAVRDRLIDDICIGPHQSPEEQHSTVNNAQVPRRSSGATRLGRGFLLSSDPVFPTWGYGWEQRSHIRPLIHTSLDVYMSSTAIHIRPLPILTRLIPVPVEGAPSSRPTNPNPPSNSTSNSPPLSPGTPMVLAPYSTPVFYVSTHAGASIPHTLRCQFWEALLGLGVFSFLPHDSRFSSCYSTSPPVSISASLLPTESFVLVLIPLFNPQGEPKVVTALWPTRLTFIDTSSNRFHLSSLPEMPGTEVLLTPPRGAGAQPSDQIPRPTSPLPLLRRRACILPPLENLTRTQRAFRALELSSHKRAAEVQLLGTAKTTAGYVESIAKGRERERERAIQERIRREREAKEGGLSSGALVPSTVSSNAAKLTTTISDPATTHSGSPKSIVDMVRPGSSWHSVPTNFFAKASQDSVVHSFYPSPPDWNPVSSSQNSGTSDPGGIVAAASGSSSTLHISHSTLHSQSSSTVNQQTIRGSLDLSNEIDLGMDIDMNDMSMGINLGNTMGMLDVNMDVNMDATGLMDGGFGSLTDAFTDDDFNYFDTAPAPEPLQDIQRPLQHLSTEDGAVGGWLANGLGATDQGNDALIPSQLQPVTPASVDVTQESLVGLHQMLEDDRELLPPAPDLIPSSPAKSPLSPGSPPTPSLEVRIPPASPVGKRLFEPIYFGNRHHAADGKYRDVRGKFAFPSTLPRSSPQSGFAHGIHNDSHSDKGDGWKLRYKALTDPRVGVINRLRGVKRKFHDRAYTSKCINGRLRDEEWESIYDHTENPELPEESSSSEEEADIEEVAFEQDQSDGSSPQSCFSRPSTPPPSGLPLMATLLYFHFHHAHLLPLGVPMRPSYGELVSDNHPPPPPISVPTPVSPAAALGNATERNKTLELLAQAIAREAVENHVWAQAWGASLNGPLDWQTLRICHGVSRTDLKHIAHLLAGVPGIRGPSSLSDLLESSYSTSITSTPHPPYHGKMVQLLQLPRISVGRAGFVHQMLPTSIRFWEKEGLGPRSGTKDVVAFALFEESDNRVALVEAWMERVGRAYTARGFGSHTAGNAGSFKCGLVPIQFDTVRKALPNLISVLPEEPQHIVIYIIAPPTVFSSLKSPALRAILTSQKGASKLPGHHALDQDRVLIHFVPDYCIADPFTYPSTRHVGLERFVNSVYDRLLRTTLRQTSRQFWELNPPFRSRFQVPSFTLARNTASQSQFEWDEHPSLNVLDRHTFLHVGYRLSNCKRWLLAACIDERGEAYDVAVWGVPHQNESNAVINWTVSNVWTFANQFAQRADSEWRIAVSKLGEIGESEVKVWMSHLESMLSTHTGPPIYVCLVCAQNDIPLPVLHFPESGNKKQSNTMSQSRPVFSDVSSVMYSAFFPQRSPIISPGLLCPSEYPSLVAPTGFGEDEVDVLPITAPSAGILPLSTTALLRVPNHNTEHTNVEVLYIHLLCEYKSAKSTLQQGMREVHADITRNWYDLTVLTRDRWLFSQHGELPFHLAALESMSNALDPSIMNPDAKDIDYLLGS